MEGKGTTVPGSWPGVRKKVQEASANVRWYFRPTEELIERHPWEVALSYMYLRVEQAHLMSLYCGAVKLHRADADLAWKAVYQFDNRREKFQEVFANVYGVNVPKRLNDTLGKAQKVRDQVVHGKKVIDRDHRMAVVSIIEYAEGFNALCEKRGGPQPFGRLQGFTGRLKAYDKAASRLILKGLGLALS